MNFFEKLFGSLMGGNDPEAKKKKQLRAIAKEYNKTKFKFFKTGSKEATPVLGKFFYDLYKIISPAQIMFQTTSSGALKNLIINASLTEEQKKTVEELTEENIKRVAHASDINKVVSEVKYRVDSFANEFTDQKIMQIENLYRKFNEFKNFVGFDFYFVVKKFASNIREHSFDIEPTFAPLSGNYISEDLREFISVAWALQMDTSWDDMFKLLKEIRGTDVIVPQVWKKVINRLRTIKEKRVFEYMIQLIDENPNYSEKIPSENSNIVEEYINAFRKQTESAIKKIQDDVKNTKVDYFLKQVFGDEPPPSMKYYTTQASQAYASRGLPGYTYAQPLGYLKSFLLNYTKKDMRELCDILAIRADWTNAPLSKPMSEGLHDLLEIADQLVEFDERFDEGKDIGLKLKTHLPRVERDKDAKDICKTILKDANNMAAEFLINATNAYIAYAKVVKMALEDFMKFPKSELILNWKELDRYSEGQLRNSSVAIYKKIFAFVSLLQQFHVTVTE